MSILYIAPYRQRDKWGRVSRELAVSLVQQMDDICIRPLYYSTHNSLTDIGMLSEYESKMIEEKDVLIQFGLPTHLNYNGEFKKNVAITMVDSKVDNLGWHLKLNLFDNVFVFSENQKELLIKSGVTSNISVIDTELQYDTTIHDMKINLDNKFSFYTDASPNDSSGLRETLCAFLATFSIADNATLFVFCNDGESDAIKKSVDDTKEALGIYSDSRNYPDVAIISGKDISLMNYAHANMDCYIDVNYNKETSIHFKYATRFGKPVITTLNEIPNYPLSVECMEQICMLRKRPMAGINSGHDSWMVPSTKSISEKMSMITSNDDIRDMCKQIILGFVNNKEKTNLKGLLCTQ